MTLTIITLNVELSVAIFYCNAESPYAECHYAEYHYAECHYAECHFAECRGAHTAYNYL